MIATTIGLMATAGTSFNLVPQIIKAIKTKSTQDVSAGTPLMVIFGCGLWVAYGILRADTILAASSSITFASAVILLFLKKIFG
jgi:MtN3 and saliva related transmembrane protein